MDKLLAKRNEVLNAIKPIMEAFKISDYDYIVKDFGQTETLVINGTGIGCSCNSIEAIINETIGYLFVAKFKKYRYLGSFETQTLKKVTEYWLSERQTAEIIGFSDRENDIKTLGGTNG